ncbi:GNAT family N-acetyltransferase [Feifania hominis]|uniref:GNAT family N-acetyltransferase n=1 Tax=Feifania hominis TaxID=2763660 RepID=A0A926HQ14_9FIRM|nr:GNAT family N-acetyltransferase [Feifania hominis]MBC8535862.1 GNAT family N-acetyltransferase [Feifania hominis]
MISRLADPGAAGPLFDGWQESIIWSCLQGVMGRVYADDPAEPRSAMAILGDFCFLAGRPSDALARYRPPDWERDFIIMVPRDRSWENAIELAYGARARRVVRYAIKKEPDIFDRDALGAAVRSLPPGFCLRPIDGELFALCRANDWSRDLVSQYEDYAVYQKLGLGIVALEHGVPVSGASAYSRYRGGIEVEIDTSPAHRRRGLAYACGAALILACLERGLYPSWDAQNLWSVALAEKLGYHFDCEYPAYEIEGY